VRAARKRAASFDFVQIHPAIHSVHVVSPARRTRCLQDPLPAWPLPAACMRPQVNKSKEKVGSIAKISITFIPRTSAGLQLAPQCSAASYMASYKEKNWRGESLFQDSHQEGETVHLIITGNRQVLDLRWAPQQEKKKGRWMWCSAIASRTIAAADPGRKQFFLFQFKKKKFNAPDLREMICAFTAEQEWLVRRGPGIGSHIGR